MKNILKFLIILLIMWPVYAQSQEPSPAPLKPSNHDQKKSAKNTKAPDNHQSMTFDGVIHIDGNINPAMPRTQPEKTTNDSNEDTSTSGWIMWATIVIAGCAALQFIAMTLQYSAMRKQLKQLRESVEATKETAGAAKKSADVLPLIERAYIFENIEFKQTEPVYSDRGHEGFFDLSADIMIWNYGKTPAVINKIQGIISLGTACIPKIEDIENPPGIFLGSDHWVRIPAASKRINEHERQNIFQNNIAAYCCGRIEYQDVFGGDHTMGFC